MAFGEPAVDGGEEVADFCGFVLVAPEAGGVRGGKSLDVGLGMMIDLDQ